MIVRMQKVTLLVREADRRSALQHLGTLGVLHVQSVRNPVAEDIDRLQAERERASRALQIVRDGRPEGAGKDPADLAPRVQEILDLSRQREEGQRALEELEGQKRWFDTWGAVSYESLERLTQTGLTVRFYVAERSQLGALPTDRFIQVVREDKKVAYLVHVAPSPEVRLDCREESMPPVELAALQARIAAQRSRLEEIDRSLAGMAGLAGGLRTYQADLERRLEFSQVQHGMGQEAGIAYLQGFCPVDAVPALRQAADREGWAYLIEEPSPDDEVPTLIRTPRWLRIVQPVFQFMGTVPGYREHDISLWFLMFFSTFFAILIGDAGYGTVFLLLTAWFARKHRQAPREPFLLMYVLSGATVVWGAASGTWFGYEGFARLPLLSALILDQISSWRDESQTFVMYLCFVIGAAHLSVAHALVGLRIGLPRGLAQLGWILILWSVFFVVGTLVLGRLLPGLAMLLLGIGVAMVLFFANFQRNVLKGILKTLGDLPLSIISSFSDIVSYLRLFAVGSASVVMASSFNGMALDIGFGSVVAAFGAAVVLALGHLINVALGLMAVIVHGVRLNMLEFSGHLSMQWSGRPYRPFRT
ncbi:MAG: hypothetical protein AB1505_25500 [Candidatus Latescibacterota bacterium]